MLRHHYYKPWLQVSEWVDGFYLRPTVVRFYLFFGEGSPTIIDYRRKGYPYSKLSTGGPSYSARPPAALLPGRSKSFRIRFRDAEAASEAPTVKESAGPPSVHRYSRFCASLFQGNQAKTTQFSLSLYVYIYIYMLMCIYVYMCFDTSPCPGKFHPWDVSRVQGMLR